MLVFLATRLELDSQLGDTHQTVFLVTAFIFGAAQLNISAQTVAAYFATLGLCVLLTMLAPSWMTWPWFVWPGIWAGLSIGLSIAFHKYPKSYQAALGVFVLLLIAVIVFIVIDIASST